MGKKKEAKKLAALAAREAELAAELERRKAAKKKAKAKAEKAAKKKGKSLKKFKGEPIVAVDAGALGVMTISAEAPIVGEDPALDAAIDYAKSVTESLARAEIIDADGKTKPEVITKRKKKAAEEAEKLDAEIKARLATKKAARARGSKADQRAGIEAVANMVDRSDEDAVRAYNAEAVKVGAALLTSDAEREKIAARDAEDEAAGKPLVGGMIYEVQTVEEVATEEGRVFEAGVYEVGSVAAMFAKPSEAAPELEEGRNGYKIIQLGADGKPDPKKVRQLTRVTTFVSNIDDETTLKKWDKRMVVEGIAIDAHRPETDSVALVVQVNDIVHRRDVAIAKATKQDRKGKLGIGEVGSLIAAASKEAKDALDKIVEEAAEIAGRNKKARAGTHLHTLAEISDARGIDEIRRMHEDGETIHDDESGEDVPVTDTDLASIEAYAERMARLGAKVIESEAVIVNDAMGYAGRLDRIIMCKLPELTLSDGTVRPADQRAKRYVADIKSGRVDLGAGKIARQLTAYALGDLYDLETGNRSRHSASRDVALVFHLPQGEGVCRVHAVDLKAGAALLKLSAEVRRARNTGKKTIDTSVDIADPAPEEEA